MIKNKGFTLIELLIVVVIIAVLATIGFTVFSGAQKNAQDAAMKGQVTEIAKAEEKYRLDNPATDVYTAATGTLATYLSSGSWPANVHGGAYTVSITGTSTGFCVMSPPLYNITGGNCSGEVAGVCTWAASSTNYCVTNRQ